MASGRDALAMASIVSADSLHLRRVNKHEGYCEQKRKEEADHGLCRDILILMIISSLYV